MSLPETGGRRLPALDSLRGVAAMTVVLLHFRDMWFPDDARAMAGWKKAALLLLHPLYSGSEAVILFFVLSGLVLSLPLLRGKRQPYWRFALRRVLRIYGPYLAALGLALCGAAIWHGHADHGAWASRLWTRPVEWRLVSQHLAFLGVYDDFQYDFVIWSLIQELRLSLLFPAIFWLGRRLGPGGSLGVAAVLSGVAMVLAARDPHSLFDSGLASTLHYAGFFLVGGLTASQLPLIGRGWARLGRWRRAAFGAASLVLYGYGVILCKRVLLLFASRFQLRIGTETILENWVVAVGAVGLLVLAVEAAPVRRLLSTGPPQFLGRVSYSLYLLHPVVLLALTFGLGPHVHLWVQFPTYLVLSLVTSWAFCLAVEEPFIRWSRAV